MYVRVILYMTSSSIFISNASLIINQSRMHRLSFFFLLQITQREKQRINHLIVEANRTEFRRTATFLRTSERES